MGHPSIPVPRWIHPSASAQALVAEAPIPPASALDWVNRPKDNLAAPILALGC